jgi:hypothetical protein
MKALETLLQGVRPLHETVVLCTLHHYAILQDGTGDVQHPRNLCFC